MARVTAIGLRTAAREAMLGAGGKGFMRFLPPGGALLATDAIRRCSDVAEKSVLIAAFEAAGFDCIERNGLLMLTPCGSLLSGISYDGEKTVDWTSPLHPVQSLALRWLQKERRTLTDDGRQLIGEALRLSWQSPNQVQDGIDALRARSARMQRKNDVSGMFEAGAILLDWCDQSKGGHADEA